MTAGLTNGAPFGELAAFAAVVSCAALVENLPESECFVACSCYDRLAVWAHGEVENTEGVTSQGHNLFHARVLPNDDLILAVPMCADNLV